MTTTSAAAVVPAPRACLPEAPDRAAPLFRAAQLLLAQIERGQQIDAAMLRSAMEDASQCHAPSRSAMRCSG